MFRGQASVPLTLGAVVMVAEAFWDQQISCKLMEFPQMAPACPVAWQCVLLTGDVRACCIRICLENVRLAGKCALCVGKWTHHRCPKADHCSARASTAEREREVGISRACSTLGIWMCLLSSTVKDILLTAVVYKCLLYIQT